MSNKQTNVKIKFVPLNVMIRIIKSFRKEKQNTSPHHATQQEWKLKFSNAARSTEDGILWLWVRQYRYHPIWITITRPRFITFFGFYIQVSVHQYRQTVKSKVGDMDSWYYTDRMAKFRILTLVYILKKTNSPLWKLKKGTCACTYAYEGMEGTFSLPYPKNRPSFLF